MSHNDIGPKLRQLRELAQQKHERNAKKPGVADLRNKIAKVKSPVRKGGGRGR